MGSDKPPVKPRHVERREKTDYVVMRAQKVLAEVKKKQAKDKMEKDAKKEEPDPVEEDKVDEGVAQKQAEETANAAAQLGEQLVAAKAALEACQKENAESIAHGNLDECDEPTEAVKKLGTEIEKLAAEAEAEEAKGKDALATEANAEAAEKEAAAKTQEQVAEDNKDAQDAQAKEQAAQQKAAAAAAAGDTVTAAAAGKTAEKEAEKAAEAQAQAETAAETSKAEEALAAVKKLQEPEDPAEKLPEVKAITPKSVTSITRKHVMELMMPNMAPAAAAAVDPSVGGVPEAAKGGKGGARR